MKRTRLPAEGWGFMDEDVHGNEIGIKERLRFVEGVDYDAAVARLAGNEALYRELVEMFFEEGFLGRLHGALEAMDLSAAVLGAHTLKGTAANLGFCALSSAAAKVECALRAGGLADAELDLFALEKEYGELRARLP